MEPYFAASLTKRNNLLESLFDSKVFEAKVKAGKNSEKQETEKKVGVICNDLQTLLSDMIESREVDSMKSDVHIGIAGGQGSPKIGLTITDRDEKAVEGRAKYSDVSFSLIKS